MAKHKINTIDGEAPVVVRNPATRQVFTTTRKKYEVLYRDKGMEIAGRDNVDTPIMAAGRRSGEIRRSETPSAIGSAADIAAGLGLAQKTDAGSMTYDQAAAKHKEIEGRTNENATDIDGPGISGERQPTKRDRGRG